MSVTLTNPKKTTATVKPVQKQKKQVQKPKQVQQQPTQEQIQQQQIQQQQIQQQAQQQQANISYMRLKEKYLIDYTTRLYRVTFADKRALRALIENQFLKYANVANMSLEQKIARATQDAARIIFRQG